MSAPRFDKREWIAGLAAGTILGLLILGIGSRAGMRVIALAQSQPGGFSLGGSMTVVFLGAVAGAATGLIFLVARALFPARPVARAALFWIACIAITLRGLRPVSTLNLSVFMPLVIAQCLLLPLVWRKTSRNRQSSEPLAGGNAQ